jgi:hypothetical protein
LVAYNDTDFGFVRITIDKNRNFMHGEYFAAYGEVRDAGGLRSLSDSFTLDLASHCLI